MSLTPGTKLGPYEILAPLGAGGMGEVYRARDTKLGRTVALKILPSEFADDEERRQRFMREAKAASAITHPNVAHIYEIGESDGVHFIAMEHVEGETLAVLLKGKPFETKEILDIGVQVADALDEAHGKGITHRDIKPGNLAVTARKQVKVLDFGLAKMAPPAEGSLDSDAATEAKTAAGVVMGTVHYMSPEQAMGREVDGRSDIFSLGVVLYELTTGRLPFSGNSPTETIERITHAQPEAIARFNYEAPPELERSIRKCLEKDPEDRYQSARELLVDLRNLKRDTGSGAVVVSSPQIRRHPRSPILVAGILAILGAAASWFYWSSGRAPQIDSLAVLPFENESEDPDTQYLIDGIAESLIVSLSQLHELKVISRSAAFRYKGTPIDPETVGGELGVDAVVLGRVVQRADNITLTAELVNVGDGTLLWSEQYSRRIADVVLVQEDLAREISKALRGRLTTGEETRLARRYTEDAEAYQTYLQGRHHLRTRTEEGFRLSIEYFERAIDHDPSYALAHSGMADALSLLGHYTYDPPAEAYRKARKAALQALELDDRLAEAHTSLAWIDTNERRWREAEAGFQRALELEPSYATALLWYSVFLTTTGKHDEAIYNIRRASELDPFSPWLRAVVGWNLVHAGRLEEAQGQFAQALELDPNNVQGHRYFGQALEKAGDYEGAVSEYRKAIELTDGALGLGDLGHLYARSGRESEARQVLRRLNDPSERRYLAPVEMVRVYAGLGETEKLHEWLEKADAERAGEFLFLRWTPVGETLQGDPKFEEILSRMGL